VLLLTYYFPPLAGPGSLRLLSFARELPAWGWDPVVVTARDPGSCERDEMLMERIPRGVRVERARTLEPHGLYRMLVPGARSTDRGHLSSKPRSVSGRLARWVRLNAFLPDSRVGWVPFAVRAARRVVREEGIDCFLTSSPPHSLQLAGLRLKKKTGLPWILELRDPWRSMEHYQEEERTRLARSLDRRLEARCLRAADRIVTTSRDLRRTLLRDHGLAEDKVVVVENGVDPDLFPTTPFRPGDRFRIVHVGSLPASRRPTAFLTGLRQALDESPELPSALELHFVGSVAPEVRQDLADAGLLEYCRFESSLPHREALARLASASLLLATVPVLGDRADLIPAKVFEYMAARRPLLVLARSCDEVHQLLVSWCGEGAVDPGDAPGARRRILEVFENERAGRLPELPPIPERYHRRELAGCLAHVLEEAVVT